MTKALQNIVNDDKSNADFSLDEILRYSRHLIMPEVGMEGQKKLKMAKVLVVGAGGLGSPIAMYLAAAGVGKIGIVDFDVVDLTNLQRQIIHSTSDIGKLKSNSARETINGINPYVEVQTYETQLTSQNALDIIREYDVIIDGTDNFPTRYLINDACVLLGKPNVYGSIFRFDGQVSVFCAKGASTSGGDAARGPCYRCLYPVPPPPGLVPSCSEGGVLGVLPGIIGSLQALEAIKLIIGKGDNLVGKLLLFDALKMNFQELKLKNNPDCPVCGKNPTIRQLIDYEDFCGITVRDEPRTNQEDEITVEELKKRLDQGEDIFILDVREQQEYQISNLNGHLIPLNELSSRVNELDSAKEIIVHCKTGNRSSRAVAMLRQMGFKKLKNLSGGIIAWSERIDAIIPKY